MNNPVHVAFRFEGDSLLLDVLRSAVQFQACKAGLESDTGAQFAKTSQEVCLETLSKRNDSNDPLEVILDIFEDRIEIAIQCRSQQMPAVGLETFAFGELLSGGAGGLSGVELLSRVDRVRYDSEAGFARTTLVKYLQPKS